MVTNICLGNKNKKYGLFHKRQKEIECPHQTTRFVMNTRYGADDRT